MNADPQLGALANNGGPTQTMALGSESLARGRGNAATCQSAGVGDVDQRGSARNAGTRGDCGIGAYDTGTSAPSGSMTEIARSPSKIIANGSSTATITVTAKDAGDNRIRTGGATVVLATSLGTISNPVTDNHNGTYTATLTSGTVAGTAKITGTINGETITHTTGVDLVAGPASGATTTINASPARIAADGSSTSTITVQAKDANGNLIKTGGATVLLNTDKGTLGSVSSLGDGRYRATLTSASTPGLATITGTINGQTITHTATVRFV